MVLSAFTPFSAVSASSNTTDPTSLLDSYGLHLPDPVSLGNATFTCQILQSLFPFNDTFSANSTYYTPLYEIPWYVKLSDIFYFLPRYCPISDYRKLIVSQGRKHVGLSQLALSHLIRPVTWLRSFWC